MRIQVVFNSTPVLVPCGDGHLTVGELIQKAILRFKKVVDKHTDDVIEVRSLRLADTGSYVDQDDEVAEVLEDREVVILDFEYVPRYVRETGDVTNVSDDSALTPSSQPFSPITLGEDSAGSTHYNRLQNHALSEGYMTTESGVNNTPYSAEDGEGGGKRGEEGEEVRRKQSGSVRSVGVENPDADDLQLEVEATDGGGEGEGGDGVSGEGGEGDTGGEEGVLNLPHPEASQDSELVVTGTAWEGGGEPLPEAESPHLARKMPNWSQVDSGYAPKSQESFSHSQPKSLEAYSTSQELSLQEGGALSGGGEFSRDYSTLTHAHTEGSSKRPLEKRDEVASLRGSQRASYEYGSPRGHKRTGSGSYSRIQRGNEGNFVISPGRSGGGRAGDFGYQPPQGFDRQPRGVDIGGRRDLYGGYPGGVRDHYGGGSYGGDHDGYMRGGPSSHGVPGEFDRSYPPPDWRRSYAGGEFEHLSPYNNRAGFGDIHQEPSHIRFDRSMDPHRGGRFGMRRDRLMEEARVFRTKSHERVNYLGGQRGAYRPDEEFREPPVDYYLSQPTTPHFPYERPPMFNKPPGNHLLAGGVDPRQMMGGPSGYSLSQPLAYMGPPRPMYSGHAHDYDRVRLLPLQERERGSQRMRSGQLDERGYSLDEEYDDEDLDRKEQRMSQSNPFKRDFRKSIFRDGTVFSQWMERVHEYGIEDGDDGNTVPLFEGDVSQSQRTPSPHPPDENAEKERGDEESEEDDEYGNVHIIELHKGDEPLGIHLTHFTAPDGTDLGVFIGAMDGSGFAAKSQKLKTNDRILACNGVDFTKNPFKNQVQQLFLEMVAKEPLLRMAVSRGLPLCLDELGEEPDRGREGEEEGAAEGEGGEVAVTPAKAAASGGSEAVGKREDRDSERKPDATAVASSNTVTNTRQIGVKHAIQITRGPRGYGFGIASRDVATDDKNQPIYVKSISHEGPAFQDGRLKIGDRILEVEGKPADNLTQPEVVQLLRQSEGSVTVLISRQEVIEKREEEFPTTPMTGSATPTNEPTTVGKTVLTLEIPLYDSGPAGLGVTVFGRSTLSAGRKQQGDMGGDMGVFIKSVVPGGAAALDGRLCRGDQLLRINAQSLLGKSNSEALDTLRKTLATATDNGAKIKLVVARKTGTSKKQPGMASLAETEEEGDGQGAESTAHEVGIDVGAEAQATQTSQSSQTGGVNHTGLKTSQAGQASGSSVGAVVLSQELEASQSSTDLEPRRGILRHSSDSPGHSPKSSGGHTLSYKSHTLPFTSSPGSKRQTTSSPSLTRRTQTNATNLRPSSPGLRKTYQPVQKTSPLATRKLRSSSGNVMGSGEFDRLEPRPDSMSDVGHHGSHGYGDGMSGMSAPPFGVVPWSPMDGGEWGPGMARAPSLNNDLSSVASSQYPRYPGYSLYPSHPHHPSAMSPSHTPYMNSPNYPPTLDAMATGHTYPPGPRMHNGGYEHQYVDGYHLRGNEAGYPHGYDSSSLRRQEMHPNELPASSIPGNDAMSNVSFTAVTLSRDMQAPIRGSNRKDRQKLESNLRVMEAGSSSEQSDIYNHTSRSTSHTRSETPPMHPGELGEVQEQDGSLGSLEDLRLSNSEMSAFRRDDKGRISITKKTKKNPRQDFAHLTLSNTVPVLEGEVGLYRTGSDGCLPEALERAGPELLAGMEVGPSLGMVKSSSLESLHNIVAHTIKRDMETGGRGEGSSSFRRPVDHSMSQPAPTQRGIDIPSLPVDQRLRENAVISFTKNVPKKSQKKSIFKKVFKKRKSNKQKGGKEKSDTATVDYDTRSLDLDVEDREGEEGEGETDVSVRRPRNSLEGYDSNDEILATIAKV